MGAVEPQLMGSAGDGPQSQLADAVSSLQNRKFCYRWLSIGMNIPQKAGQLPPCDGSVDCAAVCIRAAEGQGVVGLHYRNFLQQAVDVGVFGKQYDAEGVPIQPGEGMEGAVLLCFLVVSCHQIGKSTGVAAAASLVLLIPPVLFFVITQSNVLETMAHSGIKD